MTKFVKRILFMILFLVGARIALTYGVASLIDRLLNRVQKQEKEIVREETAVLHQKLFIALNGDLDRPPCLFRQNGGDIVMRPRC